jgi:hypothetical protein
MTLASQIKERPTADESDHPEITRALGLRSDGQVLADFRFCFKSCGQVVGWSRFRVRSERTLVWREEVTD